MHPKARVFQHIPRGTSLTLVLEVADTSLAEMIPGDTARVSGRMLGVQNVGGAEPKLRLLTETRQGVEYEAVYSILAIVRVEDIKANGVRTREG